MPSNDKLGAIAKTCLKSIIKLHADLLFGLEPDPVILQKSLTAMQLVDRCTNYHQLVLQTLAFKESIKLLRYTYLLTDKTAQYSTIITKWQKESSPAETHIIEALQ